MAISLAGLDVHVASQAAHRGGHGSGALVGLRSALALFADADATHARTEQARFGLGALGAAGLSVLRCRQVDVALGLKADVLIRHQTTALNLDIVTGLLIEIELD